MTRTELLTDIVNRLKQLFYGYTLMNKAGVLQEVRVFAQFLPQPQGITFEDKESRGFKNYSEADFESNFPCVLVRLEDCTDSEEGRIPASLVKVRVVCGIYDESSECTGYLEILKMQEMIRQDLLEHRILAQRFLLRMPLVSRLLEADTWPVYYGEQELQYAIGRPQQPPEFVNRPAPWR